MVKKAGYIVISVVLLVILGCTQNNESISTVSVNTTSEVSIPNTTATKEYEQADSEESIFEEIPGTSNNTLQVSCYSNDTFKNLEIKNSGCAESSYRVLSTHTGFLALEDKCENKVIIVHHFFIGDETIIIPIHISSDDHEWFVVDITNDMIILLKLDFANQVFVEILSVDGSMLDEYKLNGFSSEEFSVSLERPEMFRFDPLTEGFLYFGTPGIIKYLSKDLSSQIFDSYPVQSRFAPQTVFGWDFNLYQLYFDPLFESYNTKSVFIDRMGPTFYLLVNKEQVMGTNALFYIDEFTSKKINLLGVDKQYYAYFVGIDDERIILYQDDLNSKSNQEFELLFPDSNIYGGRADVKYLLSPEGYVYFYDKYDVFSIYECDYHSSYTVGD